MLERQLRELDDSEGPKRDRADAFVWGVLDVSAAPPKPDTAAMWKGFAEMNARIPPPPFYDSRDRDDYPRDWHDRA